MTLNKITCPIKWLERNLNLIIDAVNQNQPLKGTGITLNTQSPRGTVVSLEGQQGGGTSDSATTDPLAGTTWLTIDVMDSACVRSTIQVLTKPVGS